jgi:Sulfatase
VSRRPGVIALARFLNALFFLALSGYCFLAYTPFAYDAFIKPGVVHTPWAFIVIAPSLLWVTLLFTALTLLPQLSTPGARGRVAAVCYLAAGVVAGLAVVKWPFSEIIGNTFMSFVLGVAALVSPIWLAALDHRIWPAPRIERVDTTRALVACVAAAAIACATYAAGVPLRIGHTIGVDLSPAMFAGAIGSAFVLDLFVFMAVFLAIATASGISSATDANAGAEYWSMVLLLGIWTAVVMTTLVCASLGLLGAAAIVCGIAFGVAFAAIWADLARLRGQYRVPNGQSESAVPPATPDSLALFAAPVCGVRSRAVAFPLLVALPVAANAFISVFRQLDWNFLLQELSVLAVWLAIFASVHAVVGPHWKKVSRRTLAAIPITAFVLFHLLTWLDPKVAVDRYAALDPSARLFRDARTGHSAHTAVRYAYLRSQTLLLPLSVHPPAVDLVHPIAPIAGKKPHIFLLVIDSLRRDYLSPYNSRVTFTPEIAKLASESFVFDRAWTKYSGTLLSVPSIWAGGMVPHVVRQPRFRERNVLLKLLDANDYRRIMDLDSVVDTFDLRDERLVELNPGGEVWAPTDLCTTVQALEGTLPRNRGRSIFFYSLPQNIHPTVALNRKVPAGESYPAGFDERVASSLRRVDGCIGRFIDLLKREHLYDDSVIVLTSDHGDLLGEEGHWGHAFWLYPDVMRIPLIVRVPPRLRAQVRTDLDALVFSTDITPSLYVLLGYQPADLGPLFGHSFFTPRDGDSSQRRRQTSLLASSYGAVYGVVSQNGRRMYVVDTVDATEYAVDLAAQTRRLAVTPLMMTVNRRTIADQLSMLARVYHYP